MGYKSPKISSKRLWILKNIEQKNIEKNGILVQGNGDKLKNILQGWKKKIYQAAKIHAAPHQ